MTESDFKLSSDQQEALDKVISWWQSDSRVDEPFILTGGAGTGKSTIVKEILKNLKIDKQKIYMLAPTGTAVKNIQQKNPEIQAQTISSFIEKPFTYIKVINPKTGDVVNTVTNLDDLKASDYLTDTDNLVFSPADFGFMRVLSTAVAKHGLYTEPAVGFKFKDQDNKDVTKSPALLIIDELGMVSEDKLEHIRDTGVPIIGLGDPYQLKPVASIQNFLISDDTRTDFYHELTITHRQDGDNPIVKVATSARLGEDWLATARTIDENNVVVATGLRQKETQLTKLLSRADMVLSPSNRNVQRFNEDVHNFIHRDEKLAVGEKILFTSNTSEKVNGSPVLTNGMQGEVIEKLETPQYLQDMALSIIRVKTFGHELTVLVNMVHLSDTRTKYSELSKTKSQKLQQILIDRTRLYASEDAFDDLDLDLDEIVYISYGYAMTVHKSQGKEWGNVVFDTDIPQRMQSSAQPLVYTAITRAKENIIFV